MKIAHSNYALTPERQGALLRVQFDGGLIGYADCHPWPELGDQPLSLQLELLARQVTTSLTKRSLHFAKIDAEARHSKVNLFQGLTLPVSHLLISKLSTSSSETLQEAVDQGISHFKVKLGKDLSSEILLLKALMIEFPKIKFRLDFNEQLSQSDFEKVLIDLSKYLQQIEFFEDPFPFDPKAWEDTQEKHAISLACDRHSEDALAYKEASRVLILKPAIQDEQVFQNTDRQLIVTSYLDHPLGQLCAAYVAAKNPKIGVCGLLSHQTYPPNPFSEKLGIEKGRLVLPTTGYGLGFDFILQNLPWTVL